ncbi:FecR family protein [Sphingobium aquiterrae]|uniref:FecR family protein n=1 Tax=Sphingobium aquiterrae TaxID=2038656 RepID=UPI003017D130
MTGRSDRDDRLLEEAIAWHRALESDDADWDGYALWLEADPRHREVFDEVALLDDAVARHRDTLASVLAVAESPAPAQAVGTQAVVTGARSRRGWLVGSIAASLALLIGVPYSLRPTPATIYETGRNASRTLAFADGISVTLAPGSRLSVSGKGAADMDVAQGEAYFDVRHDPARTLTVTAGDYRISDIGTRFAVNLSDASFRVGVAEGHVAVSRPADDDRKTLQVSAGHQLVATGGAARLSPVTPDQVGSWRSGKLVYSDTPLALVVADIARYSGKKIMIDPALGHSHFSGVLVIGDGSKLLADLAGLMAIRVRDEGGHMRISAGDPR